MPGASTVRPVGERARAFRRPLALRRRSGTATRAWLLLALLSALPRVLEGQVPPDAAWRTLETPHFRVTFMEGLEPLARRAATRAEWAYDLLRREQFDPPSGRIEIVLTDAVDYANGMATPFPTNRIVLFAHPPTEVAELAYTTDWLELLIVHELVHIFHLDDAGGLWGTLRGVFGRNALLFPHAQSPGWLVEGVATYYESRLTPAGRVKGTLFEMVLRTATLEDAFFSIDRASGDPRRWPAGHTRYVYGALFLDHLAGSRGAASLPAFVDRYGAEPLRYGLNRAARGAWGASFNREWERWADSLRVRYRALADSIAAHGPTVPEILTRAGRDAHHPRYAPDGQRIAYSAATGRAEPALRLLMPDGSELELAPRAQLGPHAWLPDGEGLIYGDLEFRDPYRIRSDLWVARSGSDPRRLTRSARVSQPDLHPDGRSVVAVRGGGGTTELVIGSTADGRFRPLVPARPEVHWAHPRWSPSGEAIAAIRWSPGGLNDLVVLDAAGALLREVTRDRAVEGSPSWSPDGRYLLFWSDRTGIPNLFSYDLSTGALYQVTNVVSGAFDPAVSPDAQWIAFSYYRADGYHIARIPFDPSTWRPAPPPTAAAQPLDSVRAHEPWPGEARPYSPWPSARPASWSLIASAGTDLGVGVGAAIGGEDVIQRHLWAAQGLVRAAGGRLDVGGAYAYQGWGNPVVEIAAFQEWSVACAEGASGCVSPGAIPSALLRREREARGSLLWRRQRTRSSAWLRASATLETRHFVWDDPAAVPGTRVRQSPPDVGVRVEVGRSTARGFPLSVGPQTGYAVSGTADARRYTRAVQGEADATGYVRTLARFRGYRPLEVGTSTHVVAARADAGGEFGSRSPGLEVGGAGGAAVGLEALGGSVAFPVRGYREAAQFGTRAVSASAEYRFPILRVERGLGLLPLYLDRFSGDLFADAGAAWCPADCPLGVAVAPASPTVLTSVGAELLVETRLGFLATLPLRFGVAQPLRFGGPAELYLRVGRSF